MGTPRPRKRKKRDDWEQHHIMIERAYLTLLKDRIKKGDLTSVTQAEISEITGLSKQAVSRHLADLDLQRLTDDNPVKLMANQVLNGLASAAMKGDAKCAQTYFEIVFQMGRQLSIDHTTKGQKLPAAKTGDTFNILVPEWQKEVEALKQDLESNDQPS